jgi:uncharacterized protein (TIGR02145 family)
MMMMKTCVIILAGLIILVNSQAQNSTVIAENLTDARDGKIYKTIQIGNQIWMAENLNFIINENSWCYENKDSNCTVYGRLYNWNAAINSCPSGWHLPSDDEWNTLEKSIGVPEPDLQVVGYAGKDQADDLKVGGNSGFNIQMAGFRLWWDGSFHYLGVYADFWTSTSADNEEAWLRNFSANDKTIFRNMINKKYGHSVRCVQDAK